MNFQAIVSTLAPRQRREKIFVYVLLLLTMRKRSDSGTLVTSYFSALRTAGDLVVTAGANPLHLTTNKDSYFFCMNIQIKMQYRVSNRHDTFLLYSADLQSEYSTINIQSCYLFSFKIY